MLDQITGMRVFARVATLGSFAGAGRALGLSQTMVTKHVEAIEARLGVRLLHRSTRGLTLTEAGRTWLEACGRVLAEIAEAEEAATAGQAEPRGTLRVAVPVSLGTLQIAPRLGDFALRHPHVAVELSLNDRLVDLVEEGFDLAVRVGVLADSRLVARRLAPCRLVVCAAPAYLTARGTPRTLADLAGHDCLGYTLSARVGPDRWSFGADGGVRVPVAGCLCANNGDALRAAALAGLGLIYQPTFIVGDDLRAGRLVALPLDHPTMDGGAVHALHAPGRRLPRKCRALIDFLAEAFGGVPPWDRGS